MTASIFPLRHEAFSSPTRQYSDFAIEEFEAIIAGNSAMIDELDPLRRVLDLEARPYMKDQDEMLVRAYRTGACLGATVMRRVARTKGIALPTLSTVGQNAPIFEELPEHTTRQDIPMVQMTVEGWARAESRNGIGRFVANEAALMALGMMKSTWTPRATDRATDELPGLYDMIKAHDRVSIGLHDALFTYAYAAGEAVGEVPKIHDFNPEIHFLDGEPIVNSEIADPNIYADPKDRGSLVVDMGDDIFGGTGWEATVMEGAQLVGVKMFKTALVRKEGELVEAGIASSVQYLDLEKGDQLYAVDHDGDRSTSDGGFHIYDEPFFIRLNPRTFNERKIRFAEVFALYRDRKMYPLKDMGDMSPAQISTLASQCIEFGDYSWSRMMSDETPEQK